VLFVLKIEGIFGKRKNQLKKAKMSYFYFIYIYSIDIDMKQNHFSFYKGTLFG